MKARTDEAENNKKTNACHKAVTKSGYPTVRRISRKPSDDKDESEERK